MGNKSATADWGIKRNEERLYSIWRGMKNRCYCKTGGCYEKYGGVGIGIDWKTFDDFKKDMFDSYQKHVKEYGEKNTTIDRMDVKGNYCKENCKWATIKEQGFNRTNNCFVIIDGQKITPQYLAKYANITEHQGSVRIRKYKKGEFTKDQLLDKYFIKYRSVKVDGKVYNKQTLAKEIGISEDGAYRRILKYEMGKIDKEALLHKGFIQKKGQQ